MSSPASPAAGFLTVAMQPVCQDNAWNFRHNSLNQKLMGKSIQATVSIVEDC